MLQIWMYVEVGSFAVGSQPSFWANYNDQPGGWSPQMVGFCMGGAPKKMSLTFLNSG